MLGSIKFYEEESKVKYKHWMKMFDWHSFYFRLRDKYDDLSLILKNCSEAERSSETLSSGLLNYSKAFTLLGDVKDIEVQRLHSKVKDFFYFLGYIGNSIEIILDCTRFSWLWKFL